MKKLILVAVLLFLAVPSFAGEFANENVRRGWKAWLDDQTALESIVGSSAYTSSGDKEQLLANVMSYDDVYPGIYGQVSDAFTPVGYEDISRTVGWSSICKNIVNFHSTLSAEEARRLFALLGLNYAPQAEKLLGTTDFNKTIPAAVAFFMMKIAGERGLDTGVGCSAYFRPLIDRRSFPDGANILTKDLFVYLIGGDTTAARKFLNDDRVGAIGQIVQTFKASAKERNP
jgi:hypothetical protein